MYMHSLIFSAVKIKGVKDKEYDYAERQIYPLFHKHLAYEAFPHSLKARKSQNVLHAIDSWSDSFLSNFARCTVCSGSHQTNL